MQVPSTSLSKNPLSNSAFDELLALADAGWAHSNALLPGNDEGMTDQYPSILTSKSYCMDDTLTNPTNKLLSHHHLSSLEQHSIIHEHDNPQGEIEESSAVKENATIHLSKEIVVTQEMNPDLAYDVNTFIKQASQSYMSLTEDTQATNTSSRRNPHGAKPKESSTSERKYVRRSALNESSTPEEGNGAVACHEFSLVAEKISNSHDVSVPAATVADIAGENGKTCEQMTSDNLSGWTDLGSAKSLLSAVTASANSYAKQLGNNNGLNDLFIPSVIHDNSGDPHDKLKN